MLSKDFVICRENLLRVFGGLGERANDFSLRGDPATIGPNVGHAGQLRVYDLNNSSLSILCLSKVQHLQHP